MPPEPGGGTARGIALSFDDGPDPTWTPRLLDLLARLRVRATFFPIAPRAAAQPELLRRMSAAGHTVGLHCDEHIRHRDRDRDWVERDTDRALQRLDSIGVRPRLWRTPWGVQAPFTESIAAERGLALTGWTVDTHDWRGDGAGAMYASTRAGLAPGAIVLAHDGIGPGARRTDARQTLGYVVRAVAHARAAGIPFVLLGGVDSPRAG